MRALADADLAGLDPSLPDIHGHSPNKYFMHYRDDICAIIREPSEVEQEAWRALLLSACAQNDIDPESLGFVTELSSEDEDEQSEDGEDSEDEDIDQDSFVDVQEEIVG